MVGSCPECNGKMSSEAASCPHCGYVRKERSSTAQPEAPKDSGQPVKSGVLSLDPKRNLRQLVVILSVVGCLVIGWFVFKSVSRLGSGGSHSPELGGLIGPQVLIDEKQRVVDDSWTVMQFRLNRHCKVTLELDVTQGDRVTAYVMDSPGHDEFKKSKQSLAGGEFHHYEALAAKDKKQHKGFGNLGAGLYYLVIKEASAANLLGGSDSAFVRIQVTAE